MAEIKKAARRVHRHAIDEYFRVATLAAAQEQRGDCAVRAALNERCPRHLAERIGQTRDSSRPEVISGKHRYGLGESCRWPRNLGRGNDYGSELGRVGGLSYHIGWSDRRKDKCQRENYWFAIHGIWGRRSFVCAV